MDMGVSESGIPLSVFGSSHKQPSDGIADEVILSSLEQLLPEASGSLHSAEQNHRTCNDSLHFSI